MKYLPKDVQKRGGRRKLSHDAGLRKGRPLRVLRRRISRFYLCLTSKQRGIPRQGLDPEGSRLHSLMRGWGSVNVCHRPDHVATYEWAGSGEVLEWNVEGMWGLLDL